jgi:hypothetical protein
MAPGDKVPTSELGTVLDTGWALPSVLGGGNVAISTPLDESETVQAWIWPTSISTVERMRTEIQLDSLIGGLLDPVVSYRWAIDPDKADADCALRIAEDLGLPLIGEAGADAIETTSRFSHSDHIRHALLAPLFGHYAFEILGEIVDGKARLRKLAPRPPRTIQNISVANDGGLEWIQQMGYDPPRIPIERMVWFAWRKEGANWFGRSILRSCYASFIAKDRLIRDDLTKHRRNATGMPILEMDENPTPAQKLAGEALVESYRSADRGGGLLPAGWKLNLQGVSGGTSDPIESARYHDSAMAQRFQQMVVELGMTASGSRGLGETFQELLNSAQAAVAEWYRAVMQEHVIEKFVLWNDGPGAQAPKLVFDTHPEPEVADVQSAVKDGVVQMDDGVENLMRSKLRLPPIDTATLRKPALVGQAVIDPATGLPAAPFPGRRGGPPGGAGSAPPGG